jgi:hypothetical protein
MYIGREKPKYPKSGQFHFSPGFSKPEIPKEEVPESLPEPKDMLIEEHSEDVLIHWRAPEFQTFEKDRKWYLYVVGLLLVVIIYAIFTNGLVMAITFILIGIVGYIYINKEPRILDFMITEDGIIAGREIYDFDSLESFWIFYEPQNIKVLSLHTKSYLMPYVHIPIDDQDPVKIREIILGYLKEEKHIPGIAETFESLLKL